MIIYSDAFHLSAIQSIMILLQNFTRRIWDLQLLFLLFCLFPQFVVIMRTIYQLFYCTLRYIEKGITFFSWN